MAVNFETSNPGVLLSAFKKAIDDGRVVTWSYDQDGDFTHTPEQWRYRGWLRPTLYQGRLTMNFVGRNSDATTMEVYAVYHGRFIESMLAHFDKLFTGATATALATNSDLINTAA
jgi:hypothetical protein